MFDKIVGMAKKGVNPHPQLMADMTEVSGSGLAVHFSADFMDNPFHVTMWARHFDDAGVPWYAICRKHQQAVFLRGLGIRAVSAPRAHHLHLAVAPSVKAIFYVNNGHRNIDLLRRFPDLTHVQLLHGDSDKPSSFSPVTSNFDKIFVAGQLGQERYADNGVKIPDSAFVHVGRPQVKGRPVGKRSGWEEAPVIGYMPTWFGAKGDMRLSSLDRGAAVIRAIRSASPGAKILFKPHPLAFRDPAWKVCEAEVNAALSDTGTVSIDKDEDANKVYEQADMLVTDISSTMSDYLFSDRPLIVVLPNSYAPDQAPMFPMLEGSYKVAKDLSDIDAQLNDALTVDSLSERRSQMRKYAFGDDKRAGDARFIEAVRSITGYEELRS